jgi:hypothetical protein
MYVKVTAAKLVMKAACEKMKVKILRTLVQWQNYMSEIALR